tara:strand:- start:797 stop:1177 length:381 start_codon:yes stop_codon:yes gene_type:complete
MSIKIDVSIGELWDKFTILMIKKEKIKDIEKKKYVLKEMEILNDKMKLFLLHREPLFDELKKVNEKLWSIEDQLRIKEKNQIFDQEFIDLARAVYFTNDDRAKIKKEINIRYDSEIHEVKDYVDYI